MKKLMTMLAAVGMAFGLFADEDPVVDKVDFSATGYQFYTDTQWTYNGEAITEATDKVWVGDDKMLHLATGSDKVSRAFKSDGSVAEVVSNIYFDANINFEDPFDEAPVISDSDNAKIAAFVLDNSGIIEELDDPAQVAPSTNLYAIAGYYNGATWEKRAFMFATSELEGIASKQVKQLTIKAYGDVMDGTDTRMGFRFFLNGDQAATDTKDALKVYAVFKINNDGSINFTNDVIFAANTSTPYLGEGVIGTLEPAVRSRANDRSLVLGLTDAAGELVGFDLAGKGELANFTLTTESPEFIAEDSKTVKLELVNTSVAVSGPGYIAADENSITFVDGQSITVTATYTNGDDIVKWTLDDVDIKEDVVDKAYTWTPTDGQTLAISAKAAAAFVDVNGTVTPYETFAAALEAVQVAGGTLKLAQDYAVDPARGNAIKFTASNAIVLDLAGNDIQGSNPDDASIIVDGATLTITNSVGAGHVKIPYCNDGEEAWGDTSVSVKNNGTLVIAGGIMDGKVAIKNGALTAVITGGTFMNAITDANEESVLLTTGGNFVKGAVFGTEYPTIPGVPESGYDIVDTEIGGYWTVVERQEQPKGLVIFICDKFGAPVTNEQEVGTTVALPTPTDPAGIRAFKGWFAEATFETPVTTSVTVTETETKIYGKAGVEFDVGDGSLETPFEIGSVADLKKLAAYVDDGEVTAGKFFKQALDIDFDGEDPWAGIGTYNDETKGFYGTYDGNGKKISNVTFTRREYAGIFNDVRGGATIKDLTVDTLKSVAYQEGVNTARVGMGVIGMAKATVAGETITVSGVTTTGTIGDSVNSILHASGGICCHVNGTTGATVQFLNCTNDADIVVGGGSAKVGGIVGNGGAVAVLMENCKNTGDFNCIAETKVNDGAAMGLLAGFCQGVTWTFRNCVAEGTLMATEVSKIDMGSLLGRDHTSTGVINIDGVVKVPAAYKAVGAFKDETIRQQDVKDLIYSQTANGVTTYTNPALVKNNQYDVNYAVEASIDPIFTLEAENDWIAFKTNLVFDATVAVAADLQLETTYPEANVVKFTAKSAAQPVVPGKDIKTDKSPAEINDSPELKKQLLKAPDGAEVGDDYYGYFDAVNGSESGTVKFLLNNTGSNKVVEVEGVANSNALAQVLAATDASTTMTVPADAVIPGFYYSLKQSDAVTTLDFNNVETDANKLATGKNAITFELEKPENAGFYQTIVTPVPVETNRADN